MSTLDPREHEKNLAVREGFEVSDVSVPGIVVFLSALVVAVGVFFVFCFGMGKVINNALKKSDGPTDRWHQFDMPIGKAQNMESSPQMEQQQLQQLTQRFPSPRVQRDNGNQDLAELHEREDLMLNYYSWVDRGQGTVRIPIEQAMALIAQRGLPVAPAQQQANEPPMMGDVRPTVQMPLTNGFAPTAYEQELEGQSREPGEQSSAHADNH